jgi:NADP-dependent aldehyde dehydrogenase
MDSALLGSGQFCTKPGIIIVPADASGDKFIAQVEEYVAFAKGWPTFKQGNCNEI